MDDFWKGFFSCVPACFALVFIAFMIFSTILNERKYEKERVQRELDNGKNLAKKEYRYWPIHLEDMHFLQGYLEERLEHKDATKDDQILLAIVKKIIEME